MPKLTERIRINTKSFEEVFFPRMFETPDMLVPKIRFRCNSIFKFKFEASLFKVDQGLNFWIRNRTNCGRLKHP